MINLNNEQDVNKWANWLCEGKAVQYNEKTQQIERVGFWARFRNIFSRGASRQTDRKVASVVINELRNRFESGQKGEHFDALLGLGAALYSSQRISRNAPEEAAALDRYLVGVKRKLDNEDAHYTHEKNTNFFDRNAFLYDPRLLGTSREYAENNPDFVEFLLNNNIYYQMNRTRREEQIILETDAAGAPLLPFADYNADGGEFNETNLFQYTRTWEETKEYLQENDLIKAEDNTLKGHHMTLWGLQQQHSFMWDKMTPITKVEPPPQPCFQIVSYHPKEKLIPGIFDDQGHSGMVFVDAQGYVYSCGFYCHPDSNDFYKALKAQASAIRSPDLYEARVDLNWQSIATGNEFTAPALPARWNDGILQFNFEDDAVGQPCVEKIRRTWKEVEGRVPSGEVKEALAQKAIELESALATNSRVSEIHELAGQLFAMMQQENIVVDPMTAQEKFKAMMDRVHDLQRKTTEALTTGRWDNGALPYMLGENNCTHVARYYFGQFAEVNLGSRKVKDIVNTRPSQQGQFLPPVEESPISRFKWAEISVKSILMNSVLRIGSLLPFVGKYAFGRGRAAPGFTPATSYGGCLKNFFKAVASPQRVREEGMAQQFKVSSVTRRIIDWLHRPSGLLPIYSQ